VSYVKINKDLQFFPLNDVKLNWWTVKSKDLVLVNVAEACDFVHEFVTTELLALVWNVQLTKKLNLWDVTNINVGTLS
jgi:glutathione peroxidase-family protein